MKANVFTLRSFLAQRGTRDETRGCIMWNGPIRGQGYGGIHIYGRSYYAHRVAYELAHGTIPKGAMVCHHCDVRLCINPEHLFLGAQQPNMDDMVAKGRQAYGVRAAAAVLTEEQVLEIRASNLGWRQLERLYPVSGSAIRHVRAGRTWKQLKSP